MTIERIDVHAALERQRRGALVVDVRELGEWAAGTVPDALHLPKSRFESLLSELPGDHGEVLLLCAAGARAQACAEMLERAGLGPATVIDGGFRAWQAAGLQQYFPDEVSHSFHFYL